MFIHLSPIDSSCLSFSFVCLHMIIPPPCNFYEALAPHAVTPQGRVSFALFVSRGHFHFYSPVVVFFFFVRDVPWEAITIKILLTGWFGKILLLMSLRGGEGPPSHSETTRASPAVSIWKTKQTTTTKKITFEKSTSLLQATVLSVHTCSRHTESVLVSNGVIRVLGEKEEEEKKVTLC